MNVYGVSGAAVPVLRPQETQRTSTAGEGLGTPAAPVMLSRVAGGGLLERRAQVAPSEAPAGTDPELWKVLTSEERSFLLSMGSTGLTYGRQASTSPSHAPPVRGGRLDVRV